MKVSKHYVVLLAVVWLLSGILLIAGIITLIEREHLEAQRSTTNSQFPVSPTSEPATPSPPQVTVPSPPPRKVITGGNHVFQTFNNCGPASLSMALSLHGLNVSQEVLGQILRPYQNAAGNNDDKSVTLEELESEAAKYNFITYHRPGGTIALLQQFVAHDLPVITRTWLEDGEDIGHYRVVKGYDQRKEILIQDDSLQGRNIEFSYDDFNNLWEAYNFEYLVLVPKEKAEIAKAIVGEEVDPQIAWENALQHAQAVAAANPNNVYAHFNQSVASYHLQRFQASIQLYEEVADKLPPRMLWYQIEPILSYYKVGNYEQVLRLSNQIVNNQNRAFSELYALRSGVFRNRGDQTAAQKEMQKARQYHPHRNWEQWLEEVETF